MTIIEAAKWVIENRSGDAFKDYSYEKICHEIDHAIKDKVFTYALDDAGALIGLVCGARDNEKKTVTIHDILTVRSGVVKLFMAQFLLYYPDYTITGRVGNRNREFKNPVKLYTRL